MRVLDQLNIHSLASLFAAFPPDEVHRLADKPKIHHTPSTPVGWRQCLRQRIADRDAVERTVTAWVEGASPPLRSAAGSSRPPMPAPNSIVYARRLMTESPQGVSSEQESVGRNQDLSNGSAILT